MENAIVFFYDIYARELKKISNNYYFNFQNNNYIISLFDRNINEAQEIYTLNMEMLKRGIPVYKIILTKENNILLQYDHSYYILMQLPQIKNRFITYDDLLSFNIPINSNYKFINKSAWNIAWSNKIDYIEYQFSQLQSRYPIIKESINYYIGIWENAISYYNNNLVEDISNIFVSHKRITVESDLLYFYNPLNIVLDHKERDLADYLKSYIYNNSWTEESLNKILQRTTAINIIRFLSRTLFPSNYFDIYENIVLEIINEEKIMEIIKKRINYEKFLNYLFNFYEKYNISIINWLIKKD